MDSLPEQHIDSLPKDKREEAYLQVAIVCAYRGQGLAEEEVAKKAKFASVEDMYFRLERWGLSSLLPLGGKPQSLRKRKARQGEGKTEDLPPPADATELFREALESLSLVTKSLRHYQETYQD